MTSKQTGLEDWGNKGEGEKTRSAQSIEATASFTYPGHSDTRINSPHSHPGRRGEPSITLLEGLCHHPRSVLLSFTCKTPFPTPTPSSTRNHSSPPESSTRFNPFINNHDIVIYQNGLQAASLFLSLRPDQRVPLPLQHNQSLHLGHLRDLYRKPHSRRPAK